MSKTIVIPQPLSKEEIKAAFKECLIEYNFINTPKAYSKKGFAEAIGKSVSFVDQERRAGRLCWNKNGGTISIPAKELAKYIGHE